MNNTRAHRSSFWVSARAPAVVIIADGSFSWDREKKSTTCPRSSHAPRRDKGWGALDPRSARLPLSPRHRDKHNTQSRTKIRSNRDTKSENGRCNQLRSPGECIESPGEGIAAREVGGARPPDRGHSKACGNRATWAPKILNSASSR